MGRGAHTHYWDDTASEVAHTLDLLITRGRRPESATQTLKEMIWKGGASPEEEQRLKNLEMLETEVCGLFSTEPGSVSAPELPELLNNAAQKVHLKHENIGYNPGNNQMPVRPVNVNEATRMNEQLQQEMTESQKADLVEQHVETEKAKAKYVKQTLEMAKSFAEKSQSSIDRYMRRGVLFLSEVTGLTLIVMGTTLYVNRGSIMIPSGIVLLICCLHFEYAIWKHVISVFMGPVSNEMERIERNELIKMRPSGMSEKISTKEENNG